jgi:hypothetical protein
MKPCHLRLVKEPPGPSPVHPIKLSVALLPNTVEAVRKMAKKRKCTMTEVIINAIGSEMFIVDHEDDCKFLLEARDGTLSGVKFP